MLGLNKKQLSLADSLVRQSNRPSKTSDFLNKISDSIDWFPIEALLIGLYPSERGRKSYPPLVLFKILLLQNFFALSDPKVEEEINDRLSFRNFLGLSLSDSVPDETVLVRFRQRIQDHSKDIFNLVNAQLIEKGLIVRSGSIIDATIIEAPSSPKHSGEKAQDTDAEWTTKNNKSYYGYKSHVCGDDANNLIDDFEFTPANVHDSNVFEEILPPTTLSASADKAYPTKQRDEYLEKMGIENRILKKAKRNKPLSHEDKALNKANSAYRSSIERIFAHLKTILKYRKTRYIGLAKNRAHFAVLAMAYNLKRTVSILSA